MSKPPLLILRQMVSLKRQAWIVHTVAQNLNEACKRQALHASMPEFLSEHPSSFTH